MIDTSQRSIARCPHFIAVRSSSGVSARIKLSSQNEKAAVEAAVMANVRWAHAVRLLHHTNP